MAEEMFVENAALVIAELTARLEAMTAQAMVTIRAVASDVEQDAKQRCPVLTGALRDSITTTIETEPTAITASIGTPVEYGPFIEHGTYKMAAQPFLLPAFVIQTAHLNERLASDVSAALAGL